MRTRSKLATISASFILGIGGAALTAVPAHADTYIRVCNSGGTSGSYTRITVSNWSGGVYPGQCTGLIPNFAGQVTVDTDPDGPSHSYKIKPCNSDSTNCDSYGPCHTNSDNHASNPPDVARVYYRNFNHGDCTN